MSVQVLKSELNSSLDKLDDLKVSYDLVHRVVEAGIRAYMNSSPFHPKTHAGSSAWNEIVAELRKGLKAEGWSLMDRVGQPLIYNKDLNVSIGVSSGDKETGISEKMPSSKNPKGAVTQNLINQNMDLFSDAIDMINPVDSYKTYFLLYYFDIAQQEARFELSLPTELSVSGYISDWSDRYCFQPLSFNDDVVLQLEQGEFSEDIDFDIDFKVTENA